MEELVRARGKPSSLDSVSKKGMPDLEPLIEDLGKNSRFNFVA